MPNLIFCLLLFFQVSPTLSSTVVSIQDGDTLELRYVYYGLNAKNRSGKNLRIRLEHVDCPEKGELLYRKAKQFTADKCKGKTVKIKHSNRFDRYGRLIAEVILPDGKILNQELLKAGLAVHYKKYSSSYVYSQIELQARIKKIGIWM